VVVVVVVHAGAAIGVLPSEKPVTVGVGRVGGGGGVGGVMGGEVVGGGAGGGVGGSVSVGLATALRAGQLAASTARTV
jgi:hypothetical protein